MQRILVLELLGLLLGWMVEAAGCHRGALGRGMGRMRSVENCFGVFLHGFVCLSD